MEKIHVRAEKLKRRKREKKEKRKREKERTHVCHRRKAGWKDSPLGRSRGGGAYKPGRDDAAADAAGSRRARCSTVAALAISSITSRVTLRTRAILRTRATLSIIRNLSRVMQCSEDMYNRGSICRNITNKVKIRVNMDVNAIININRIKDYRPNPSL